MAKSHYKFNPEDLKYNRMPRTLGSRLWKFVLYIGILVVSAVLLNVIYSLFFDTPRERQIRRENEMLLEQHELLSRRLEVVDTVMKEVMRIDEDIYRVIFEAEPPDQVNRGDGITYQQLLLTSNEELVNASASHLDSLLEHNRISLSEYDMLMIRAENKLDMLAAIPAIQPLENDDLTLFASGFGHRIHPIYKISKMHEGVDFTAQLGTPVRSTGQGVVRSITRTSRGLGNRVEIDHGYGYISVYACLDRIQVRYGQRVERGEQIAVVGESGLEVAPHLHYEVRLNGEPMNPVNYFFMELSPEQYDRLIEISMLSGQSFD